MVEPCIVFVVGHSNWGKSQTLRELTDGSAYVRHTKIGAIDFFVRRMSNDDQPKSFMKIMQSIEPSNYPYVIAALCPKFDDIRVQTKSILAGLRAKGYGLYFWVIQHKYSTAETIAQSEIAHLQSFGKVEILAERCEANVRALKFKSFIKHTVLE